MPLRIENAVDLHVHFHPDYIRAPEGWDVGEGVPVMETAKEAADEGYAAVVLKSHGFGSAPLAKTVEGVEPRLRVFGGICTDFPTGGLNPFAIEAALALDTKIVWLPTGDGACDFERRYAGSPHFALGPVRVVDADDVLVPAAHEIADLAREADAVLATGHTTAAEHYAVVKSFASKAKVLVTHAGEDMVGPGLTLSQISELADLGAVIELSAMHCQTVGQRAGRPFEEMVALIKAAGVERCVLSSDYGWSANLVPRPVSGMRDFLEALWDIGVSEADLQTMVSDNPARLLNMDFA
jgi:hypothetical protein